MKRISIAAEVVAFPSILFLDEPTASLDAYNSLLIVQMLRELAKGQEEQQQQTREGEWKQGWEGGMTVVASIHQPSREVFERFDSLMVLNNEGEVIYIGQTRDEDGRLALSNDFWCSIQSNEREEPASWILRRSSGTTFSIAANRAGNGVKSEILEREREEDVMLHAWCALVEERKQGIQETSLPSFLPIIELKNGKLCKTIGRCWMSLLAKSSIASTGRTWPSSLHSFIVQSSPSPSFLTLLQVHTRRAFLISSRAPYYKWYRIGGSVAIAVVLSGMYHGRPEATNPDLMSCVASIFIALIFVTFSNSMVAFQIMDEERPALTQECFMKSCSVSVYALSWLIVDMMYALAQSLVFVLLLYFPFGFSSDWWRVAWFWVFLYLYTLFTTAFGQAVAAISPNLEAAKKIYSMIAPVISIMSGMSFMPSDLPQAWVLVWVVCPLNKALEGIVMTQWWEHSGKNDKGAMIEVLNSATQSFENVTRWEDIQRLFKDTNKVGGGLDFSVANRWRNTGMMVVTLLSCYALFMFALGWRRSRGA